MRDKGPYPVLALMGEQGSAKTSFATILRSLIDPSTAPLRSFPREDRDLFIAASNGWVVGYDNVSRIPLVALGCIVSAGNRRRLLDAQALHRR